MDSDIFYLGKFIIVPVEVDFSSILDPDDDRGQLRSVGPLANPAIWLHRMNPQSVKLPLELGLGSRLFWSARPTTTPPGVGSLACITTDAAGLLERKG